jgi:hypothetical protein
MVAFTTGRIMTMHAYPSTKDRESIRNTQVMREEEALTSHRKAAWVMKVMAFMAEHDLYEEIWWHQDLSFFVGCNDWFYWATADAVDLLEEDFPVLEKAVADMGAIYGCLLYCARQRGTRPQGAAYKHLSEEQAALFDAAGPPRSDDLHNPVARA